MRYLLDTNFISELRRGNHANRGVQACAMANDSGLCALSVVTLAEIRRGIEDKRPTDSRQVHVLEQWLGSLLSRTQLLPYDLILAATALEHGLTVITRNMADFVKSGASFYNPWN